MTKKLEIKINQGIIQALGKSLYKSEFGFVVLREIIQNSLDANSTEIDVTYDQSTKRLAVLDNGCGIAKIDGLLNVIGESIKNSDISTIGGFGLAKLAIFGCKFFKFTSISGSFKTGFEFDSQDKLQHGTLVQCEFEDSDISWNFESKISAYLQSINRAVIFTLNSDEIKKYDEKFILIGDKKEISVNSRNNGYVTVRVNGLPTFNRYVRNLESNIIYDYTIALQPYDIGYPLSSNRDSFLDNSKEGKNFESRITALETKLEFEKKLAEKITKTKSEITWRGKKWMTFGNVTEEDFNDCSMVISTYKRYLESIASVTGYRLDDEIKFGLSDGSQERALYSPSNKSFAISKHVSKKGEILALAIHEFVHFIGYDNHDQNFVISQTNITGEIMTKILEGEFRK